ncbi:hypothetical protein B0H63DRAFT_205432 [Podospora didyma]|uniref:Transmembrane protein n=1 Tax=Podospora didyma TaxID=330526 RepID=A0AAE0NH48_9PEZI|nr:hypothetical protein B0H63DRAFT_205432 [Podospora didyma]
MQYRKNRDKKIGKTTKMVKLVHANAVVICFVLVVCWNSSTSVSTSVSIIYSSIHLSHESPRTPPPRFPNYSLLKVRKKFSSDSPSPFTALYISSSILGRQAPLPSPKPQQQVNKFIRERERERGRERFKGSKGTRKNSAFFVSPLHRGRSHARTTSQPVQSVRHSSSQNKVKSKIE